MKGKHLLVASSTGPIVFFHQVWRRYRIYVTNAQHNSWEAENTHLSVKSTSKIILQNEFLHRGHGHETFQYYVANAFLDTAHAWLTGQKWHLVANGSKVPTITIHHVENRASYLHVCCVYG